VSRDFLRERKDSLVEEFFHKEEAKKVAALRKKLEAQETREELKKASCVTDDAVLDRLIELGITAETVAALSLVPLVYVAWADGKVQPEEYDAILEAAQTKGIEKDSDTMSVLSAWLEKGAPPQLYETWVGYVKALRENLEPEQCEALRDQIVGFARSVAEAAGGFLGIGKVSGEEKQALDDIAAAFE
jgi:hypothetical protein